MDDFLRDFIVKKWKIGRFTFTFLDALLAVCITGTGIFLRLPVINYSDRAGENRSLCWIMCWLSCAQPLCTAARGPEPGFLTYAILDLSDGGGECALWNVNAVYYVILFFVGFYLYIED